MSERSVRVLARKLRGLEDAAVVDAQRLLGEIASDLASRVPVTHPALVVSVMLAGLTRMAVQTYDRGVLLLSDMMEENRVGLVRDLRGVAANSGRGEVEGAIGKVDDWSWVAGAQDGLAAGVVAVTKRFEREVARQISLAYSYNVDDPWGEAVRRLVSETPVRVKGRSGKGVAWSAVNVFPGLYVNVGYSMVNGYRRAVIDEALDGSVAV